MAGHITALLQRAATGDEHALDGLVAEVYAELEQIARSRLYRQYGSEAHARTLEPAALVNETLLKLIKDPRGFDNRAHFFTFATRVMVNVMLEYQRRRSAAKRGGDCIRVTLSEAEPAAPTVGLWDLESAFEELDRLDPRKAQVLRLKAVWGLENAEVARALEISERTVERDWRFARAWLLDRNLHAPRSDPG
ncbi:MAG TPA: ECF-type sigma factor [Thermoanaerobaculia bacterium]|nr:ECF-type sigma factor [Thermoanaerobaculia bacterium]